jgi:hypothetical protein
MAIVHGKNGVVRVGAAGQVNEVQKFSLDYSASTVDATSMGDTAEKHLIGILSWSGDITCLFDKADADGQELMLPGASVLVTLMPEGLTTGLRSYSGTVTITDVPLSVDKGSIVERSFKFKGNGALTIAALP